MSISAQALHWISRHTYQLPTHHHPGRWNRVSNSKMELQILAHLTGCPSPPLPFLAILPFQWLSPKTLESVLTLSLSHTPYSTYQQTLSAFKIYLKSDYSSQPLLLSLCPSHCNVSQIIAIGFYVIPQFLPFPTMVYSQHTSQNELSKYDVISLVQFLQY